MNNNLKPSIAQKAKKIQFLNDTSRNISSNLSPYVYDYGKSSTTAYTNERETTSKMHTLNINQSKSGNTIAYSDNAKNTMKQTTVHLNDTTRNINPVMIKDTNTGLTSWNPKNTQKETTVENKYKGQANKKDGMGYIVAKYDAKITNKETTLNPDYSGHATSKDKEHMVYSTYSDPIKVRYNNHMSYVGIGNFHTKDAENRNKYMNANISTSKEQTFKNIGRPNHTNSALGKIQSNVVGTIKSTDNLLLKEQYNTHTQNISNIYNNIPSYIHIGNNTQQEFHNRNSQYDMFSTNIHNSNNRFNGDLINQQLQNNPFYNLKRIQ